MSSTAVISFVEKKKEEEKKRHRKPLDDREDVLAYRNNSTERRKRVRDRRIINKDDTTRPVICAIAAFRRELIKASTDHKISFSAFTPGWDYKLRYPGYHLSDKAVNELSHLTSKEQSAIVYEILKEIHNNWVKTHPDDFFEYFIDCESYYLPIEFIEENLLHNYYNAINYLLQNFGLIKASWEETRNIFHEHRTAVFEKYHIEDCDSLAKAIVAVCSDYDALTKKIVKVMTNHEMAFDVACQILIRNPNIFSS